MRPLMFTLSLSSALALSACAGGVSGSFRGNNGAAAGPPVAASAVKIVASKADMTGAYTEIGTAKGAVDQAAIHCGQHGGTHLIMNTQPFQSGNSWSADATCATVTK
jgi:hypothetical protein